MKTRLLRNVVVIFLIYNLIILFIGWNAWIWLHTVFQFEQSQYYIIALGVVAYSYFLGRLGRAFSFLKVIGAYWMGFLQYAILIFPLVDVISLVLLFFNTPKEQVIYWAGAITLFILFAILVYGSFNAYSPIVRKYTINIKKPAGTYKQLRIAMASDMHLGNLSGKSHLKRLVEKMNTLEPDLILFPGDIIDDEPGPFARKRMGDLMKYLKAPLGIYGVLGNHEYYGGKIPEFLEQMKAIDIKILLDEVIQIDESLYILGRRDKTEKNRKSLEELLEGVDKRLPLIMMDHQPYFIDQALQNGVDLMLSGHTHRGQMAPNHLITKKIYELDWGYMKKKELHVIVSSGYGFWGPPLRIGSRSEIVQIDISFS
jgi:predicted MPP superfamily phosphohydrolase